MLEAALGDNPTVTIIIGLLAGLAAAGLLAISAFASPELAMG